MNISLSRYAVRYKTHDGSQVLTLVENPDAQAGLLRDLLLDDIVAEAEELTFIKDVTLTWRVRREFVEATVKDLVDGERDLDEVNGMLRPLSPGLLDDDDVEAILDENPGAFIGGCIRTSLINELANLMDQAAKAGGLLDIPERDLDAIEAQRDWLIRVLAGQMEHAGLDHPCHRCVTVVRPCSVCIARDEAAVHDLDDDTTTETSEEAA